MDRDEIEDSRESPRSTRSEPVYPRDWIKPRRDGVVCFQLQSFVVASQLSTVAYKHRRRRVCWSLSSAHKNCVR